MACASSPCVCVCSCVNETVCPPLSSLFRRMHTLADYRSVQMDRELGLKNK